MMKIDFTMWMAECERLLEEQWWTSSDTIPDYDWWGLYQKGYTSDKSVKIVMDWVKSGKWV